MAIWLKLTNNWSHSSVVERSLDVGKVVGSIPTGSTEKMNENSEIFINESIHSGKRIELRSKTDHALLGAALIEEPVNSTSELGYIHVYAKRGEGVGTQLMAEVESQARDMGASAIHGIISPEEESRKKDVIYFYKKLGFEVDGDKLYKEL